MQSIKFPLGYDSTKIRAIVSSNFAKLTANNGVHNASWSSNKFPIEYTIKHDYHPLFHFLHSPYGWTENEMRTDIIWRSWWRSLDARPASSVAFSIINGERWMAMPTRQFLANAKLCVRNNIYIYIFSYLGVCCRQRARDTALWPHWWRLCSPHQPFDSE